MRKYMSKQSHSFFDSIYHIVPGGSAPATRIRLGATAAALLLASAWVPATAFAADPANPICPEESAFFNPSNGEDIVLPKGYKIEVFAKGLNFPTDVAFQGKGKDFRVIVLESGTGLPSRCNNNEQVPGIGKFDLNNPFTPDILVFDRNGNKIAGPLGKPTPMLGGLQADGPAIGLAFEREAGRGRLFVTDSNQGVRGAPGSANNSSRISVIDPNNGFVTPFITGLPTGDHPTEQVLVKDNWIYWSQGSATNAGVTGHDNGGPAGANQHEIACQDITLSFELWDSGDSHLSSGYSVHGIPRPGALVPAFESATRKGMCTGAILRARLDNPMKTIEPFSWGYRNPYGIRFAPENHPLKGRLLVSENGEDERGARPVNNTPDRLHVAEQNRDGTPDFHGWPDIFGFLDSTQAIFNPIGGPGDDLGTDPAVNVNIGQPVRHVLAFPPQPVVAPLAILPANVATVGLDFAPKSFTGSIARRGAALVAREGDFGFSPSNGRPVEGHDIMLVNFSKKGPLEIQLSRFAFNCKEADQFHIGDTPACKNAQGQAFVNMLRAINRPTTAAFGPDGALYLVDYGAVRDFGRSEPGSQFNNPLNAALVQIPGTGVIWKISRTGDGPIDDDDDND